ncbi:ATP-binding protein [Streptomyces sp. 8N114]|uniref:ATP-binding protein n=1 Tax=Streptomyces sp. 8N114 TaxID=3457419 RepID=UPI003FD69698
MTAQSETETTRTPRTPPPLALEGDSPASVPRARGIARAFAENLAPRPDPGTAETLALVACELATSALRHGGGRYTVELGVTPTPKAVSVAVSDRNPRPPRARTPDLHGGTGGFGWPMVRRLASNVTITPRPRRGKTIRARLPGQEPLTE